MNTSVGSAGVNRTAAGGATESHFASHENYGGLPHHRVLESSGKSSVNSSGELWKVEESSGKSTGEFWRVRKSFGVIKRALESSRVLETALESSGEFS
ncbi:hypothetical protein EYF80_059811 [Liparis tanakae]|uniref:Uncharacterized protein n=1 Tax=Liparis tanakae TaxID=230148 RepID=A0A4Z2EMQ4_9TELE|nr:hypothetical protein EYF80_059811 [Liparis tanakae]